MFKRILIVLTILTLTSSAKASEMRTFLLSCAYGSGIGALAGLTALAFSETPGSNLSYITRGASVGLYTGMGIGYYLITMPESSRRGYTEPSAQVQPRELPSMPVVALLPSGTREKMTADLYVGYRFNIP